MIVIKGYKCTDTEGKITTVTDAFTDLMRQCDTLATAHYAKLLANEIELLVDDISLNVVQRPNAPIYNVATDFLSKKISHAIATHARSPYNLEMQAAVYELDGDVYIQVMAINPIIRDHLTPPPGFTEFSVYENAADDTPEKEWAEIMNKYDGTSTPPLAARLYPNGAIEVGWSEISQHFHDRKERAALRARYQMTGNILNMLGMGAEIPSYKLLPYFDETIELLGTPDMQADMKELEIKALSILVNITKEDVKRDPNAMTSEADVVAD